jgi:hypothetical protein
MLLNLFALKVLLNLLAHIIPSLSAQGIDFSIAVKLNPSKLFFTAKSDRA